MKGYAFKLTLPGKKPADDKDESSTPPKETPSKDDDTEGYTKAELGKTVASAIRSGDGEAIYEAVKRLMDTTPSDAE